MNKTEFEKKFKKAIKKNKYATIHTQKRNFKSNKAVISFVDYYPSKTEIRFDRNDKTIGIFKLKDILEVD